MFMLLAEDVHSLYPTQLAQSPEKSYQLKPSLWCMTWNSVTPIFPLSVGLVPHRIPTGPNPSFLGFYFFPSKVILGYLSSLWLPVFSQRSKLSVGPQSCWTARKWTGRLAHQKWNNIPFGRSTQFVSPNIVKLRHTRYFIWRPDLSHKSRFCFLQVHRISYWRKWSSILVFTLNYTIVHYIRYSYKRGPWLYTILYNPN